MTLFVVLTMALALLSVSLVVHANSSYRDEASAVFIVGLIGCIFSVVLLIFLAVFAVDWVGAQYKADVVNREYKTNYTQAEMFYASDVIDTVRELQRKRVEVNGDLMREDTE